MLPLVAMESFSATHKSRENFLPVQDGRVALLLVHTMIGSKVARPQSVGGCRRGVAEQLFPGRTVLYC